MSARAWHPFSLEPDFPVLSHSGLKTGLHGLNFHKQFQIANLVLRVHFNVFEYKLGHCQSACLIYLQVLYFDLTRKLSRTKQSFPTQETLKNQVQFSNSGSSQEPGMVFQTKTRTGYYFILKSQTWDWVVGFMGFRPQWRTVAKICPVHRLVEHLYPHPLFELQSLFTISNIQCWLFCHLQPWCNKGMHGNGMNNIKWQTF